MKSLIKIVTILLFSTTQVYANPIEEVTLSTDKQSLMNAFVDTRVEGRIVKLKVSQYRNKKSKVSVIWHPRKIEDVLEDMLIILETVNKVVPNFSTITLRAVHPDYMRWSKRILWEALITKKGFLLLQQDQLDKFVDRQPRPLF
jgi:hypothetical protein